VSREAPPPVSSDIKSWAEELTDYLTRANATLPYIDTNTSAAVDGVFGYDPSTQKLVVSIGGQWRGVTLDP